ncbi:MAG: hypothetical protein Q8P21_02375 [bacterium]|nr:hypothetical protein [bacterium]
MSEIAQKPEKLASAVYLITSFFNDQEPLKWRLRMLSNNLVSEEVKDKFATIKEILSLFFVAKTAGLVSDTNCDIFVRELAKLENEIKKPLNLMLSHESPVIGKTLPTPQRPEFIKDKIIENRTVDKPILREFGAVSVKKNSRQSTIIAILKRKKEIMIKDVSPLITGCSEKTIQRELSAMVQAGVLRKIGEKRWSRYTLA